MHDSFVLSALLFHAFMHVTEAFGMSFPLLQRRCGAIGILSLQQKLEVSLFGLHPVLFNQFVGLRDVVERSQRLRVVFQAILPVPDGRVVFFVLIVAVGECRVQVEHRGIVGLHALQRHQQDVNTFGVALQLHQRCSKVIEWPGFRGVVQVYSLPIVLHRL